MGFSPEWLALRAEADDKARDKALEDAVVAWAEDRPLRIVDLGGGTGAAWRALSPRLPDAAWTICDWDEALLAHAPAPTRRIDLARDLEAAFDPRPDLVTAFAFLDLVSRPWLARLFEALGASGAALYAPLTYDGREIWAPAPPHEAEALAVFHADMRRDKGFGPALGPDAPAAALDLAAKACRAAQSAPSDWRIAPGPLMAALAEGGAEALRPALPPDMHEAWRAGRANANAAMIGHLDIWAPPAAPRT